MRGQVNRRDYLTAACGIQVTFPIPFWTGSPQPPGGYMWLPARMNFIFGGTARGYEIGYVVTRFDLVWT